MESHPKKVTYSCQQCLHLTDHCTLVRVQDLLTGVTAMSQIWKLKQSRNEWKRKAVERAVQNRYLRKELARVKRERDRLSEEPKDPEAGLP